MASTVQIITAQWAHPHNGGYAYFGLDPFPAEKGGSPCSEALGPGVVPPYIGVTVSASDQGVGVYSASTSRPEPGFRADHSGLLRTSRSCLGRLSLGWRLVISRAVQVSQSMNHRLRVVTLVVE